MSATIIPHAKVDLTVIFRRQVPQAMVGRIPIEAPNGTGVNMGSLLDSTPKTLKTYMLSSTNTKIQACGLPKICLRFIWPGYEGYGFTDEILLTGKTDGQVAIGVALAYKGFIQKALGVRATTPEYAITPNSPFARIENINLRAIIHAHADIFIADVEVVRGHPMA